MSGRRLSVALLVAVLLGAGAAAAPPLPRLSGPTTAVLLDVGTGRVLYSRQMHRRTAPASTTKILTAILAMERFAPAAPVTISAGAAAVETGSVIGLRTGERWKADDLIAAMLLRSANDAAVALAEAVSGTVPRFASAMNARAARIGARATHFANPHGLDAPRHHTTAYDLALIARYALRNPRFAALVRAQAGRIERPGRGPEMLVNRNTFLARYPGADGVKTGMTAAAGYTFVASATRAGWQLLAVVLNSHDMYADAGQMLDYGFENFSRVRLAARGQRFAVRTVGRPARRVVAVVPADVHAVVRRGAVVTARVTWRPDLRLPIAAGATIGDVLFFEGASAVARSAVVAAAPVGR
jgi:D-alanyl-D-alanine carboxypeptidase (penicillin-binding protein 5/6)